MLTTNNAAAMSASDKRNQMISHVGLCPALYLFLMGVISLQFLFPWNAATFVGNSGDWDMATNSTYEQAWTQYEHQPCSSDEVKDDGNNCINQIFHPVKEWDSETANGETFDKVKKRGDWWNCDLPSNCHMRYMYQEEARNAGIYYIGMGVMAIYALVTKSHYAARATSGLHLFLAVYCILHALALLITYVMPLFNRDEQMVPYLYRTTESRVVTTITALIFLVMGVVNILAMVFGMMRAGELTANARAANIASSGLVAQFGTAEFSAMDGGNKGKQTVSTAGLCCLGLWVLPAVTFFTWIWSYGVTFKYYGSGDLSNLWHENATIAQGAEFMYNLYPGTRKDGGNDVPDCSGAFMLLDTGLKVTNARPTSDPASPRYTRRLSAVGSYGGEVFGSDNKLSIMEYQECKKISTDIGMDWYDNRNDDGPVWMIAYHTIRTQAKMSGAFYAATMIACFFSVLRGASFAARSVSGLSLGFAVVGALMMLQSILLWYAPDYNKVPQYFRDDTTVATLFGLLFGGIVFALNLVGFIVGIMKTKEVEGAAPAAAPAAAAEPTSEMPPQAEEAPAADAEAPSESVKVTEEAPAAEA